MEFHFEMDDSDHDIDDDGQNQFEVESLTF